MNQDSLQCDGTTAAILNDLFSESPSVVDSAVERIRTAWQGKGTKIVVFFNQETNVTFCNRSDNSPLKFIFRKRLGVDTKIQGTSDIKSKP